MIKRIFCAFLTAVMCLSYSSVVMAAKKPTETVADTGVERKNIYSFGGFNTLEDIRRCSALRSNISLEQGKAKSGGGCAKIVSTSTWATMSIPAAVVKGETYDISFDYMTDNEPATMRFQLSDNTNKLTILTDTISNEWKTARFTYKCTGVGTVTDEQLWNDFSFEMYYGSGQTGVTMYMDNFSVIPRGNVKADYSRVEDPDKAFLEKLDLPEPKTVTAKSFADVKSHWSKDTVETLATYGYIDGMNQNTYAPDQNVTRAEFVKMMIDGVSQFDIISYADEFSDISGDEWYADYIATANKFGLLGNELTYGGMFYPDRAITRAEAASIASKIAKIKKAAKNHTVTFADMKNAKPWAKTAVQEAAEYGLILGYENGKFMPDNTITRAEAAEILYRVAELSTKFKIYVDSENGDDTNAGTKNAPLATIYAAKNIVANYNKNMKNNIEVKIRGEHYLDSTLEFTVDDSGTNGYDIIYTSWGEEQPTLTMGKKYHGFSLHDSKKNIYKIYVGTGTNTRQAFFNDKRGIRSRTVAGMLNPEVVDKTYYLCDNTELLDLQHPEDLEIKFHIHWQDQILVDSTIEKTDDGRVKVTPEPERWARLSGTSILRYPNTGVEYPSYFENAYEFLDAKGEWYMNSHDGYMYYIPRDGEDMSTMELTIPIGEEMITASGADKKNPAHNIVFDNLMLCETGWLWPSENGTLGWQNAKDYYDKSRPSVALDAPGAITVTNGYYIDFTNNTFTRLGSVALNYCETAKHCDIIGNEFYDISSMAMHIGTVMNNKKGLSKTSLDWVENIRVNNNYIHDTGVDYQGTGAISTGWLRDSEICHNEIANTPYSGMHIGWGWHQYDFSGTDMYNVKINNNFIQETQNDRLYDGGAIYTLGAQSVDALENMSEIKNNYMVNHRNQYPFLYPDEGSWGWHMTGNVMDQRDVLVQESNWDYDPVENKDMLWLMLHGKGGDYNVADYNYTTNIKTRLSAGKEKTNVVENNYEYPDANWPAEAQEIIKNAGVEPEYQDNFDFEGPKYFITRRRTYTVPKNGEVKMDLKVTGRHFKEYDLADFNIDYYVSNPDVLEVTKDGVLKAIGTGYSEVVAVAEVGGVNQIKQIRVYAGETVEKVNASVNDLKMINGNTTKLDVITESNFGNKNTITDEAEITYASSDTSVATVDSKGMVTAVGIGEATINIDCIYQGEAFDIEIPVSIINYCQEGTELLSYEDAPSSLFSASSWTGKAKASADGKGIAVQGGPAYLDKERITNKLIAFDMKISEDAGTWPSITFGAKDRMNTYNDGDVYLIGFKENIIELQRFNKGVRTMIFGDAEFAPIGGPGVPNEGGIYYKPGETYSVVAGILDEENGTRIVLTINGVNVIDYTDTSDDRVSADGFFGIYEASGTFEFSPYTGKTE